MDTQFRLCIDLAAPFTAAFARAEGLTDHDLRVLVRQGRIVRRRRGIYVGATYAKAAGAEPATAHALEVAVLCLGLTSCPDLVAVGTSAARIHGLEFYKPPPRDIHVVTADPTVRLARRDGYMLDRAVLPEADVVEAHGVLVTSPARTFFDVAADLDFVDRAVLADSGLHKGIVTREEMLARLDLLDGRLLPHVREAIEFADPAAESALESAARAIFHLMKLPPPLLQVWLLPGIRVDFYWPQFRTVAEADGLIKYLLGSPSEVRQSVDDERARERAIVAAGHALFRFAWDDLADRAKLKAGLQATFAHGLALGAC